MLREHRSSLLPLFDAHHCCRPNRCKVSLVFLGMAHVRECTQGHACRDPSAEHCEGGYSFLQHRRNCRQEVVR
jgi:hypothetical protein